MPRIGRLHLAGGYYHLMGRGLERRYIFDCDEDKEDFFARVAQGLEDSDAVCLAWAMLSKHYYLLISMGRQPLSELMRTLLGGYTGSYKRRHGRVGYVFQNRFKSVLCDEGSYLKEWVRYIHLDPLRAQMVKQCSQSFILGV